MTLIVQLLVITKIKKKMHGSCIEIK